MAKTRAGESDVLLVVQQWVETTDAESRRELAKLLSRSLGSCFGPVLARVLELALEVLSLVRELADL